MTRLHKTRSGGRVSYEADHYGEEPVISSESSSVDLIHAYNWYGHYHVAEDAKAFVLAYFKKDEKKRKIIEKIDPMSLYNIGWNCRILSRGGSLPEDIKQRVFDKLDQLISDTEEALRKKKEEASVIPLKEREPTKATNIIADLEEQVDNYIREGCSEFDAVKWFSDNGIKPHLAKEVFLYYTPIYAELVESLSGTDADLKEAYSHLGRKNLKRYAEFIRSIIAAADDTKTIKRVSRKPRKKKVKPASVLVKKLNYLDKDEELGIHSLRPEDIIGAKQVWVFNAKTRFLSVYNAIGEAGLGVKGSTLTGFDGATSISKKVRKPKEILAEVVSGGKVVLRKLMGGIRAKESEAKGRINKDTLLVRIIK